MKKARGSFSSEQVLDERKECFTWLSIRSRTSSLDNRAFSASFSCHNTAKEVFLNSKQSYECANKSMIK